MVELEDYEVNLLMDLIIDKVSNGGNIMDIKMYIQLYDKLENLLFEINALNQQ